MNYQKHYDTLMIRAQLRASSKNEANELLCYSEAHHIIPRCMNGLDIKENIAHLTASEHFVAHQLLVKMYPEIDKLVYSANMMCVDATGDRMNNKRFEWLRRKLSELMSERMTGQTKENNESVRLSAEKRSGENHALFGQTKETNEFLARLSELNSSRTKENDEGRRSQSEKISGENHYTFGKNKDNCEGLRKVSEALTGRTKDTHPHLAISAEKQTKINSELRAELVLRRNNGEDFKSLHDWILSLGIKITITNLRRTYNRETGTKLSRGGISKIPLEIIEEIVNRRDSTNEPFTSIWNWVLTQGIKVSRCCIKHNYDRYKRENQ